MVFQGWNSTWHKHLLNLGCLETEHSPNVIELCILRMWYPFSWIFIHSLRKRSILINEAIAVSTKWLISSIESWVISKIFSFVLAESLWICSNFNFRGMASSIGSKNGRSRYPSNVSEENHLFFQVSFPSLMMDSTISQMISHVSITTSIFLTFSLSRIDISSGLYLIYLCHSITWS